MQEYSQQFIQAIKNRLIQVLDSEKVGNVVDIIVYELKDYDLAKKNTDIVPYVNANERILNSFATCLIVEGKSKGTIAQYKYSLYRLFDFLGNKEYTEITTADIMAWLAFLKISGVKSITIRNQRSNISPFFSWLHSNRMIVYNPCDPVKPIKVPHVERMAFSSEEVDTIRSICKNLYERALVETLLSSGVRVSELTNLKIEDVDFDRLIVHVKNGKGGKDRTVFITPVAKKYIVQYLEWNKYKTEYVFSSRLGGKYKPDSIRATMGRMSDKCGIHIHPHRFRRTLATNLARKGMPIQEIQKLLGHSKISTTQTYIVTSTDKVEASYRQYN